MKVCENCSERCKGGDVGSGDSEFASAVKKWHSRETADDKVGEAITPGGQRLFPAPWDLARYSLDDFST